MGVDLRTEDGGVINSEQLFADQGVSGNRGAIWDENPTNNQGSGGPTIVALIQTTVQGSGLFNFSAKGNATCVAADVSTWNLTMQKGTGPVTTTGGGSPGTSNSITPPEGGLALIATGVAGTGIAITAGAGTSQTLANEAATIGASATLLDKFSCSGTCQDGATGKPYAEGNVFLVLSYTNSVANRQIGNLVLSLTEVGG
jgi:hypothetical protein